MSTQVFEALELEPGIHTDVEMDDYLVLPYVSASGLEKLRRSPLQYLHSLAEPKRRSDPLERGTALHLAVLEPQLFEGHYVVSEPCAMLLKTGARKGEPCGNGGLKRHREMGWLCGMHMKGLGSGIDDSIEVLTAENHSAVTGMRDAIHAHPRGRTLFEGKGEFEATVIFDDPETEVRCRTRPDRLVRRAGMLVDIKTCRDAAAWAFPRQAESLGYFRKLALYRRGLRVIGWPYSSTAVLAIESTAPYDMVCYLADEADLDSADEEVTRLLREYRTCSDADSWGGYANEFQPLRRPAWAKNEQENAA